MVPFRGPERGSRFVAKMKRADRDMFHLDTHGTPRSAWEADGPRVHKA